MNGKDVADDALEQLTKIVTFDSDTARDHYQFSVWVAAFAMGGLALSLAKGSDFFQASWLLPWVAQVLLIVATLGFSIALVLSAVVQRAVTRFREGGREITTMYINQRNRIVWVDETISVLTETADDCYNLVARIANGEFVPEGKFKDRWNHNHAQRAKLLRCYRRALVREQILVGVAYLLVIVVALPFGHQPI